MTRFLKKIFFVLGILSVAMGTIGIILPLLPSTVFFILAAWFFAKSSERFYTRIINDPFVGLHVRNYLEKKGMPLHAKCISICMIFVTISISIMVIPRKPFLVVLLLSIAFGVSGYIISLNTINKTSSQEEHY
jgi:uncharacterized protein